MPVTHVTFDRVGSLMVKTACHRSVFPDQVLPVTAAGDQLATIDCKPCRAQLEKLASNLITALGNAPVVVTPDAAAVIAGFVNLNLEDMGGITAPGEVWAELRGKFPQPTWQAGLERGRIEFDPDAGT